MKSKVYITDEKEIIPIIRIQEEGERGEGEGKRKEDRRKEKKEISFPDRRKGPDRRTSSLIPLPVESEKEVNEHEDNSMEDSYNR